MMTIEEILRAKHDIGPGEENDFRISDYSQFADLRRQATGIFVSINCRHCWNKPHSWWHWCNEYYACVCNRENKRNRFTKSSWSNSKSNNDAICVEAILLCIIGGLIGIFIGTSLLYLFASLNDWYALPFSAIIGSIGFCALVGLFWYMAGKKSSKN